MKELEEKEEEKKEVEEKKEGFGQDLRSSRKPQKALQGRLKANPCRTICITNSRKNTTGICTRREQERVKARGRGKGRRFWTRPSQLPQAAKGTPPTTES